MKPGPKGKIKGRRTIIANASLDVLTDAAIRALVVRENLSYSGAICGLVLGAAMRDPDLKAAVMAVLTEIVQERIQKENLTVADSERLMGEILGPWHSEMFAQFSKN